MVSVSPVFLLYLVHQLMDVVIQELELLILPCMGLLQSYNPLNEDLLVHFHLLRYHWVLLQKTAISLGFPSIDRVISLGFPTNV